jgi:hypothetical protein
MAAGEALTALLRQFDSIANAPMTVPQRQARAAPLLHGAGITVADIVGGLEREGLSWNGKKAAERGVAPAKWREAMRVAAIQAADSLDECWTESTGLNQPRRC